MSGPSPTLRAEMKATFWARDEELYPLEAVKASIADHVLTPRLSETGTCSLSQNA